MDYQKIDELLLKIKSAYESIGAETELVVEKFMTSSMTWQNK